MAQAYVPIQTVTVGSGGAASIEFTNIPATYTDLLVLVSARSIRAQTQDGMNIKFNSSTSSFSGRYLATIGTIPQSGTLTNGAGSIPAANATASTFSNHTIYIPNYTSSNSKSYSIDSVRENNSSTVFELDLIAGLWSVSSAITAVAFYNDNSNFAEFSTATLYGIGGTRASGGTVTADGRYTYHTFTSTGTFTSLERIKGAEVLLVAGGGAGASVGGSAETGGGGGAGGFRGVLLSTLSAGNSFTVLVGAGGSSGTSGSNSAFAGFSATGGGAGGGNAGGSGGGGLSQNGAQRFGGAGNAGNYNPVEGYAGGNGNSSSSSFAGGGGGAGAAGANGTSGQSGAGGIGSNTYLSWATITGTGVSGYYAGGGGGGSASGVSAGSGGLGGGGNGGSGGTANTGGGGGGSPSSGGGGTSGGSGIVIVRYPN